ncbi:hypothetical protein FRC10_002872 [Ceratobasidium sp. 414]|nr:hypothetical protein FRC10_002872 [Ceratobasidium sp. 414]
MSSSSATSKPLGGRVALVGTGSRAAMFVRGVVARPLSQVVAICEPNSVRADYYNELLVNLGAPKVPIYTPEGFKEMLSKEKVETLVVTCIDALHDVYIVPALEAGATTQSMNSSKELSRKVKSVKVSDLARNINRKIHPLLVLSVHFEWLLDTVHGADYFRRWHRQKSNSGGLMVHKSGHHFDLVNWWLDARPVTVAGMGRLAFYGDKAGKEHGWARDYVRARGQAAAKGDPFAIQLEEDETLKKIYADAEVEDGYHRDQNVFAPGIGIEDDMAVLVQYNTGATLSYHLGYHVMFNGSHGRLELEVVESTHRTPSDPQLTGGQIHGTAALPNAGHASVKVQRLWEPPQIIPVEYEHGDHGGGDKRMLNVLFGPLQGEVTDSGDAAKQSADERDGTYALAVGLMANESFKTGKFVTFESLGLPI